MFRKSTLRENEDPDAWIITLEESRMKIKVMGPAITDDLFMIHVLTI
jgi:hypothetical protein